MGPLVGGHDLGVSLTLVGVITTLVAVARTITAGTTPRPQCGARPVLSQPEPDAALAPAEVGPHLIQFEGFGFWGGAFSSGDAAAGVRLVLFLLSTWR